jgi:methylenetetrahydrofolate dehydrogenase (NADP+)/methenyltetrahydrofolate cyclohydrolase
VLVGNNPASESYVGSKMKMTVGSGMRSFDHRLPATTSESELLALIARLNADPTSTASWCSFRCRSDRSAKHHRRDRSGKGCRRLPSRECRTPVGGPAGAGAMHADRCVLLAKTVQPSLAGLEAVVIGRSNIVGKPLAQLLLAENATVTVAHSKTRDLPAVCRRADVCSRRSDERKWCAATGQAGATVIDVGINRVRQAGGKSRIVATWPLPK